MRKINIILLFLFGIFIWVFLSKFEFDLDKYISVDAQDQEINLQKKYSRFEEIEKILKREYYDQNLLLSWYDLMIDSALSAYVGSIDDPYTVYMDRQQSSWFYSDLKWEKDFEWIWAYVMKKDYYILIEEVLKNSPAFNAGLVHLDRILMIWSGYTEKMTVDEAVSKIRWPQWTKVFLLIERYDKDGNREILEKEVIRDKLIIPSVVSEVFEQDWLKIWYLEIYMVGEETENIFDREIKSLINQNIDWIILDLRWNGWWFLPIAVEISSHFIPAWETIVTAKYKIFWDEIYKSKWYNDLQSLAVVVLVDGMTASAGEIIAMALQEIRWATLIGTQTFGKWSIQTLKEFDDGSILKYTIWKRYSPEWKNIDKIWVSPNVVIEFDIDAYKNDNIDNQLEEAKKILIYNL